MEKATSQSQSSCSSSLPSCMPDSPASILITGAAAGRVGGIGNVLVRELRALGHSVRALVRTDDERAAALRALGAEVMLGDLTKPADVVRAVKGVKRVYFGMSVSSTYLEASVIMAAALRAEGSSVEVLVNMSQMSVSSMSLSYQTGSDQQRQHWLAEQALDWSGLPVVHVRPTVFLEHFFFSQFAADSIARDGTIRLPFPNSARTSPIAVSDIARVIIKILTASVPALQSHISKHVYELTGARAQNINDMSVEYAEALGRPVRFISMPFEEWDKTTLQAANLPPHVYQHLRTMALLHANNEYDRMANGVELVTGNTPMTVKDYVLANPLVFAKAMKRNDKSKPHASVSASAVSSASTSMVASSLHAYNLSSDG